MLSGVVLFVSFVLFPCNIALAQSADHKLALLVGINDYKYSETGDLKGAVNDVRNMRRLLVENFGFPDNDQHIVELTDKRRPATQ